MSAVLRGTCIYVSAMTHAGVSIIHALTSQAECKHQLRAESRSKDDGLCDRRRLLQHTVRKSFIEGIVQLVTKEVLLPFSIKALNQAAPCNRNKLLHRIL